MISPYFRQLIHNKRTLKINEGTSNGSILYWMNRDQRLNDNHALSFAQSIAIDKKQQLIVYFGLDLSLNKYNDRQVVFLIQGLEYLEKKLHELQVPFIVSSGSIMKELLKNVDKYNIGTIVTDFSPLKQDKASLIDLLNESSCDIYQVDAHNIVPCWVTSDKREFAAYTIRPKINKFLDLFSQKAPDLVRHPFKSDIETVKINWNNIKKYSNIERFGILYDSGEAAAYNRLDYFIKEKIHDYSELRNDPTKDNQSNLSVYLHFGQISSRSILERINSKNLSFGVTDQFIDELVIRKELSDNFCFYTPEYDSINGFPDWAQKSLKEHQPDPREYLYSLEEFENAETNDPLWNAAQKQMVQTGKMHGYMRMYWAKKIMEWTPTPKIALEYAIYLNDKYQLDGNDPNGYAGIAWSIGGVHDRAWFGRDIYGKVRYMNYNGCKRKFDVNKYIEMYKKITRMELI